MAGNIIKNLMDRSSISRKISYLLVVSILFSCAESGSSDGVIGDPISRNTGLAQGSNWTGESLWFHDTSRSRVHRINVANLTHDLSLPALPSDRAYDETGLFSPFDANWTVELTYKNLRVIAADGSTGDNPFTFQGQPVSVSWDPLTRAIVIYDDVQSVMMGKLSEDGSFETSGIIGSILDTSVDGASVRSGDLDDSSRLILTLQNNDIAVVDLDATLANEAWSYTSYTPAGITEANWIAPLKGGSNQALVSANEGIFLIDYVAQTILDQVSFSDTSQVLFKSRNLTPHIAYNSGSNTSVVYPDSGSLTTMTAVDVSLFTAFNASILDLTSGHYTVSYKQEFTFETELRVSRYRLSDGLVIADQKIQGQDTQVIIGENYAVSVYDSALGHIVRTDLTTSAQTSLSGFNEPWFENN